MNILALDLGTRCGFAVAIGDATKSGTRNLGVRASETAGARWSHFRLMLGELSQGVDLAAVYFEDVKAHGPNQVIAAHIYGGFKAHLEHWCEVRRIPIYGVGVGVLKRHWTGKGNAKKADMVRACRERGHEPKDDNEADALALLDYAQCDQGRATPTAIEQLATVVIAKTAEDWADPSTWPP